MHSVVRERAKIGFPGGGYESPSARRRLSGGAPPTRPLQFHRPAWSSWRATGRYPSHRGAVDSAPEHPTSSSSGTAGSSGAEHEPAIVKCSGGQVQLITGCGSLPASRFDRGDAAHVHSPAGGQGMNIGIRRDHSRRRLATARRGGSRWMPTRTRDERLRTGGRAGGQALTGDGATTAAPTPQHCFECRRYPRLPATPHLAASRAGLSPSG
jgi:hypothetical protein